MHSLCRTTTGGSRVRHDPTSILAQEEGGRFSRGRASGEVVELEKKRARDLLLNLVGIVENSAAGLQLPGNYTRVSCRWGVDDAGPIRGELVEAGCRSTIGRRDVHSSLRRVEDVFHKLSTACAIVMVQTDTSSPPFGGDVEKAARRGREVRSC